MGEAPKLPPITEAGSGALHEPQTAYLGELIRKVNDLFEGDLTDQDKLVYVNNVIKGKLLESETLRQQAAADHPQAALLRQLAQSGDSPKTPSKPPQTPADDDVRGWLHQLGAPLYAPQVRGRAPQAEETLSRALVLSHSDPEMARVLPLVLWRQRADLDLERLAATATKLNERATLGYFLELAGNLGKDRALVEASRALQDRRRRRPRMFFSGPHGRRELAAAQQRTPRVARRWGYLMATGVDSFRSVFEKFAER